MASEFEQQYNRKKNTVNYQGVTRTILGNTVNLSAPYTFDVDRVRIPNKAHDYFLYGNIGAGTVAAAEKAVFARAQAIAAGTPPPGLPSYSIAGKKQFGDKYVIINRGEEDTYGWVPDIRDHNYSIGAAQLAGIADHYRANAGQATFASTKFFTGSPKSLRKKAKINRQVSKTGGRSLRVADGG